MFIVWIGAFSSLGVVLFGTVMPEFGSFSAAVCALLSIATRVYSFDLSAGSMTSLAQAGWHIYTMLFFCVAIGSIAGYVSHYFLLHQKRSIVLFLCRIRALKFVLGTFLS